MTREEAHRIAYEDLDSMYHSTWIKVVVDDIYDELESRVCKNCIYCEERDYMIQREYFCNNAKVPFVDTEPMLGCNKFERNTNETNN
jgi:hypothetical protein